MLSRLFVLVALHLLIATNICTAMKKIAKHQEKIFQLQQDCQARNIKFIKSNILQKLSFEGENPQAEFLINDDIVITDLNGYHITNLKTTERTTLNRTAFTTLVVRSNKEKFAIYLGSTIKIYDSTTRKKLKTFRSDTPIHIALFNPSQETIILCDKNKPLTQYNYTTNKSYPITISTKYENYRIFPKILSIAMHPTKNQILSGHNSGYISVHNLNNNSEVKIIAASSLYRHYYHSNSRLVSYSPNGELIANSYAHCLDIIDSHSHKVPLTYILNQGDYTEYFTAIVFHPNNSVIAGLIAPNNYVAYMDTKKEHYICIMSPLFGGDNTHSSHVFSFSTNGRYLMIILNSKGFIVEVPFEALYQDNTKEKLPYLLFLLNNINNSSPVTLPADVITMLKQNQINVFKR